MEYELAKEMGNLKHAANVLVSNYHFRDTLWESEVASMFSGLISNPPNHQYQSNALLSCNVCRIIHGASSASSIRFFHGIP